MLHNLLALTYDQVLELFRQRYGRGHYHAAALYRNLYQRPDVPAAQLPAFASNLPWAHRVEEDFGIELPRIVDRVEQDGVIKLVLRLGDGLDIETVILPMPHHVTMCISSQAGCRMGCRFCQTGRMGLLRQLRVAEIVAQVYLAQVVLGYKVRNVVFMGMGEPLDNWESVAQAIDVLADQRGLNIALRRITLSTIGLLPGLERLAAWNLPHLSLAISLNAPDNALRHHLMPATRDYALEDLKRVLQHYPLAKGKVFFMAYVLIKGVNDSPTQARRIAALLKGLPVKINLIPYNPDDASLYRAPSDASVEKFRQVLVDEHLFVRLRGAKGNRIRAACGQLVGKR